MSAAARLLPLALLLASPACGPGQPAPERPARERSAEAKETPAATALSPPRSAAEAAAGAGPGPKPEPKPSERPPQSWRIAAEGGGATLSLGGGGGGAISLSCPGANRLVVNLPSFAPIGSEERMSLGAGGTAVALVADTGGDRRLGGVTAAGPVPAELAAILADPAGLSVAYGARTSGPHPLVPTPLARRFLAACAG